MTFIPTHVDNTPAVCHCCGRHAIGVGIGTMNKATDDPHYLCGECILLMEQIKHVRRMDQYELHALDGGVEAVGAYLEQKGVYDLSQMDELDARMIVKAAWQGCADRLREIVRKGEVPF